MRPRSLHRLKSIDGMAEQATLSLLCTVTQCISFFFSNMDHISYLDLIAQYLASEDRKTCRWTVLKFPLLLSHMILARLVLRISSS